MNTHPPKAPLPPSWPNAAPQGRRSPADKTELYLKEIKDLLGWILGIMVLVVLASAISGFYVAHEVSQLQSPAAACQSLGGTNPAC